MPATNELSTKAADEIPALVKEKDHHLTYLLETHLHADRLTASIDLEQLLENSADKRPPACCIGMRIRDAPTRFDGRYGIPAAELVTVFDRRSEDGGTFAIGDCASHCILSARP